MDFVDGTETLDGSGGGFEDGNTRVSWLAGNLWVSRRHGSVLHSLSFSPVSKQTVKIWYCLERVVPLLSVFINHRWPSPAEFTCMQSYTWQKKHAEWGSLTRGRNVAKGNRLGLVW